MSKLADLAPTERLRVMDLVRAAGVDVRCWTNFKKGKNKKKASANPKYCFEWAFVQPNKVVVLTMWYDSLMETGAEIWCELNTRDNARRAAQLPSSDPRRRRRQRFDEALREAFTEGLPVRLIVVSGKKRHLTELKASHVTKRKLDSAPWAVTAYDFRTSQCRLTRNAKPIAFGSEDEAGAIGRPERLTTFIDETEDEIERSAGFQPNAKIRRAVEQHAMKRVEREFQKRGYDVKDVSKQRPFDLLCSKADEKRYIEVKGKQGRGSEIILTAGEVEFIQNNTANCILCVVQNIQVKGKKKPKTEGGSLILTEPFDLGKGQLNPMAFIFRRKN